MIRTSQLLWHHYFNANFTFFGLHVIYVPMYLTHFHTLWYTCYFTLRHTGIERGTFGQNMAYSWAYSHTKNEQICFLIVPILDPIYSPLLQYICKYFSTQRVNTKSFFAPAISIALNLDQYSKNSSAQASVYI